jgi:hypothetical protein
MFLINIEFKPDVVDPDKIVHTTIGPFIPPPVGESTIIPDFNILSHVHLK